MQNSQALGNIQAWKAQNADLMQRAPLDTGVQLSQKELNDRNRATIQHQTTISKSKSDSRNVLDQLKVHVNVIIKLALIVHGFLIIIERMLHITIVGLILMMVK